MIKSMTGFARAEKTADPMGLPGGNPIL
jgi:Uncharacterized stress-induced protein